MEPDLRRVGLLQQRSMDSDLVERLAAFGRLMIKDQISESEIAIIRMLREWPGFADGDMVE
ncbi:hypothetical protein NJB14197_05030 [Mycobacterium montefiorense]|uniref:Uncharacterized protein n=1 Tax=Mycobacterium montefiorense TaxID=154654 RepID=A0AA37PVF3_9MYCO|nr:hypothetical protein MmonteBS_37940 [Mycobacterium montefiorense]GKU33201.1 hypothetical protein NJB14191_05480 [Mycobacterium montefiorense]GKU42236.1 hypothetical protein NJB14192_42190 [Mycobacterium montefiorense]GKU44168.1 hypothetical protein NJB14194_07970 [Mycobacterium montefiorense]GKU53161.1 hypothetical protein NJB14195_44020 [Mycobacterium montefiorense]